MRRNSLLALTGAALLAFTATPGAAGFGHGHGKGGCDPARLEEHVKQKVDKMIEALGADDQQRQTLYGVRDRAIPLLKEKMALKKEAKELWKDENPSKEALHQMIDRKAAIAKELADLKLEAMAALTPEQRQKAREMHKERHHHGMHGKMHGEMHGGMPEG
jgi:Spy/CpxP family protein refolding chaperone